MQEEYLPVRNWSKKKKQDKRFGVLCKKRSDDRNARTLEVQIERERKKSDVGRGPLSTPQKLPW